MKLSVKMLLVSCALVMSIPSARAQTAAEQRQFTRAAVALVCPNTGAEKKLNLNGHKFNFERKMTRTSTHAYGRFSHFLRFRPDDQVAFEFTHGYDPNRLEYVFGPAQVDVDSGGLWGGIWGDIFGLPSDSQLVRERLNTMIVEARGKSWKTQAAVVIATAREMWIRQNYRGGAIECREAARRSLVGEESHFAGSGEDSDADADEALYESGALLPEGDEQDEEELDEPSCEDTGAC